MTKIESLKKRVQEAQAQLNQRKGDHSGTVTAQASKLVRLRQDLEKAEKAKADAKAAEEAAILAEKEKGKAEKKAKAMAAAEQKRLAKLQRREERKAREAAASQKTRDILESSREF